MSLIESQGIRLRRRIDKLKSDIDFLAGTMLTNPCANTEAHTSLLQEWEEEIEVLEVRIQQLRNEWNEINNQYKHPKKHVL